MHPAGHLKVIKKGRHKGHTYFSYLQRSDDLNIRSIRTLYLGLQIKILFMHQKK